MRAPLFSTPTAAVVVLAAVALHVAGTRGADLIGDIQRVVLVHRHGARAPENVNPSDAAEWEVEAGFLTGTGEAMLRAFGERLRDAYFDLPTMFNGSFDSALDAGDVFVRSTDFERTLMSVEALLAGLFGADADVAVHTVPFETDMLMEPLPNCPSYYVLLPSLIATLETRVEEQYKQLEANLSTLLGWDGVPMPRSYIMLIVYDNARCKVAEGIDLHSLVEQNLEILRDFSKDFFYTFYSPKSHPDPRGLVGAPLMREMLDKVEMGPGKLYVYSGHDSNIVSSLISLDVLSSDNDDHVLPPFGTSIVLEVRSSGAQKYVNALYGMPVAQMPDEGGETTWTYEQTPLLLRCVTGGVPQEQCTMEDFVAFVGALNAEPGPTGGCCLRTEPYEALGCNDFSKPFASAGEYCQLARTLCPATACTVSSAHPDSGYVLDAATGNCVKTDDGSDGGDDSNEATKGKLRAWQGVAATFMCIAAVLLVCLCVQRRRASRQAQRFYELGV